MNKKSLFIETENSNNYLYNRQDKLMYIVHPLLKKISNLEDISEFDQSDIEYYKRKLSHFDKYHFQGEFKSNITPDLKFSDFQKGVSDCEQITLEVTDRCNLACEYCGYRDMYDNYELRDNNKMTFVTAKAVIDYFFDLWNSNLSSSVNIIKHINFYGGEPLLNVPLIKQVLEYIKTKKKKDFSIEYTITTNGVLLEKHIDFIINNGIYVNVSLDGDKEANSYRVFHNNKESFSIIYNTLKKIQKIAPEYFESHINFQTVLHSRNSVKGITDFFRKEFSKTVEINELNDIGIAPEKMEEFLSKYKNLSEDLKNTPNKEEIENAAYLKIGTVRDLGDFQKQYLSSFFMDYNDLFFLKSKRYITGTCKPFEKKVFVSAKGLLMPCETIGHENPHGRVDGESAKIDLNNLYSRYKEMYKRIYNTCNNCWDAQMCMRCIFSSYKVENNYVQSTKCEHFQNKNDFIGNLGDLIGEIEGNIDIYRRIERSLAVE